MKPATTAAAVLFGLIALIHLLRLIQGWPVLVNGMAVPAWVSVVGLIVGLGLAVLLWREARPRQ
jgi:membrane associated rhomboid family serine protease